MKIHQKRMGVATVAGVFVAVGLASAEPKLEQSRNRQSITGMHGKPAPALQAAMWRNTKANKAPDLKGKIVVLDFWATWCGPCIAAIPHTNELMKKYGDKGVVIIGVCATRGGETMERTAKKYGVQYPVALDDADKTKNAFKANSYPDYYIIDREGKLRWGDIANKDVEKAIKELLAEK